MKETRIYAPPIAEELDVDLSYMLCNSPGNRTEPIVYGDEVDF